jgi:hypothetical protein
MRIVRQRSPERYLVLDNIVIEDRSIPYRALGVVAFLLSRPDGWETDSEDLAHDVDDPSDVREGRDAVRTALRQLEARGYLKREKQQDPRTGRWSTVTAVVDRPPTPRNPSSAPTPRKPTVGCPDVGFLGPENHPSTEPNDGTKSAGGCVGEPPPSGDARELGPEEAVEGLLELCAELRVIRREEGLPTTRWTDQNIRRSIALALAKGYPPTAVPDAYRALARDSMTKTPGRGHHDGPWWEAAEADELRRRRLGQAAAARIAAAQALAQRAADCTRCNGTGTFVNFHGRTVRCDHIPDEETA